MKTLEESQENFMEIRIAKTFLKVVETGNITQSAEQLGYSQGSVTAHIQQLERELDVKLFDRIGRGVQLTDAGRQFLPYAVNLAKAAEAAESFHLDHAKPTGPLIIEASSSVSIGILPKLLLKFQKRYPGIRLTIKTSDDVDVTINGVRQNRLDFAFIMHLREDFPGCRKAMEKKIEFAFVAPTTDPLTKEEDVPLQRIFDGKFYQSFIASDKEVSLGSDLAWVLEKKEIQIQPAMEFGSTAAIVHLLQEGEGRSFLPRFMVEKEIEQGRLAVIPTEEIDVDIWSQVYYNENKWINPQMQAFIDFIEEELTTEKKREE